MAAAPSKHALAFIFLTVLIDTIGFGIVMPVMPQLIVELTGKPLAQATLHRRLAVDELRGDAVRLRADHGQSERSLWPQARSARLARRLRDRLCADGLCADLGLALFRPRARGRRGRGLLAGLGLRCRRLAAGKARAELWRHGRGVWLGFIVGPALGGLLGEFGPRAPFFAAAALGALNFVYGLFVLPESLPPERRRKFEWKRANPLGTLMSLRRYPAVMAIAGAVFLWQLAHQVYPSTWSFFAKIRFDWSPGRDRRFARFCRRADGVHAGAADRPDRQASGRASRRDHRPRQRRGQHAAARILATSAGSPMSP